MANTMWSMKILLTSAWHTSPKSDELKIEFLTYQPAKQSSHETQNFETTLEIQILLSFRQASRRKLSILMLNTFSKNFAWDLKDGCNFNVHKAVFRFIIQRSFPIVSVYGLEITVILQKYCTNTWQIKFKNFSFQRSSATLAVLICSFNLWFSCCPSSF